MASCLEQARNSTLLLMVLFENVQVFNSRSEMLSALRAAQPVTQQAVADWHAGGAADTHRCYVYALAG